MWGCSVESYIDVLEIEYKDLTFERVTIDGITEIRAILVFSFLDGNGILGAREGNNSRSRIFIAWEEKTSDDTYEPLMNEFDIYNEDGRLIGSEILPFEGRTTVPYGSVMDKDGANNRTLKGKIDIPLMIPLAPVNNPDVVRIAFYITDRNGKRSITKGSIRIDDVVPPPTYTPDFNLKTFEFIDTE